MDEIGTPYCVTYDYQSLDDNTVTLLYRDSMRQERVKIDELVNKINYESKNYKRIGGEV